MQSITPFLWFDGQAEEAAKFYVSVFKNSKVKQITHYTGEEPSGRKGQVMTVDFKLDGQEFVALNGGPDFTFNEAVSFQVSCDSQKELDMFWSKLSESGQEGPCGWLKDKFGLSWQIVPSGLKDLMANPDTKKAEAATKAMLGMKKLDLAEIQRAADRA